MIVEETQKLPLLRQTFPAVQPPGKRPKVVVKEASTQKPLILQGSHSFVSQFDATLATYSGCPFKCLYCYVPDVLWNLPDKLGGWGNYLNPRSQSIEWLERHIGEIAGMSLFLSATTDPYNPYEREHQLTRKMLQLLAGSAMDFLLISTRGTLVERDLDLFTDSRLCNRIEIGISIPSDLRMVHQAIEPYAPSFKKRFGVARLLKDANIPVRIHAAPLALHSTDFYALAAECANWVWFDEPEHGATTNPDLAPWFYEDHELQSLVTEAMQRPELGAVRVGYGKDRFGWRWNAQQQTIVPPPARVKFPPVKRKKGGDNAK